MAKIVPEIIRVDVQNLILDKDNPRLPESISKEKFK